MNKPLAVIISDIHYSLNTLKLADAAMRHAIDTANRLNVPVIVAGDLHDTKANLRAECVNAMIETFDLCFLPATILVGNHDKINEKSEDNALNFLEKHSEFIVSKPGRYPVASGLRDETNPHLVECYIHMIPYQHDPDALRAYLKTIPKGSTVIMHQGIQGSESGEYIQDKSAINPEDVAGLNVISGHYHTRQTIELPEGGRWQYVGNPFTLNYAEANDPPKGYLILMDDGTTKFVPTNLRKHVKFELTAEWLGEASLVPPGAFAGPDDLLWVKVHGTRAELAPWTKDSITRSLYLEKRQFRLDLIPTDPDISTAGADKALVGAELMDSLLEQSVPAGAPLERLKAKWRECIE